MYVVHTIPTKTKSKNIYRYLQKVFSSNKRKQEEKKSWSERKVSKKQLIEESNDNDEVISNVGGNNFIDDLSDRMMKWQLEVLMIISRILFILPLELISILF